MDNSTVSSPEHETNTTVIFWQFPLISRTSLLTLNFIDVFGGCLGVLQFGNLMKVDHTRLSFFELCTVSAPNMKMNMQQRISLTVDHCPPKLTSLDFLVEKHVQFSKCPTHGLGQPEEAVNE